MGKMEAGTLSRLHDIIESSNEDFLVFTQTICPYCTRAFRTLDSKGLSYSEVNLDNFEGLRKEVVIETGHRTVPVVFDMRGDDPVFVGGSDHLMEYL
ncbi:MAG: glutaredoxin domain-containing protein [Candidatus Thalassarchaeaceae archaeon]|jgi:glutaredoxin 3|nr:glutaredoxin domain-containing protein [Candidatus Thalassarchaeaceae archaeon]